MNLIEEFKLNLYSKFIELDGEVRIEHDYQEEFNLLIKKVFLVQGDIFIYK
jgi:hypothetical protein